MSLSAQNPCSNQPITPQEMIVKMGRGINIGNTMEAVLEGNWQNPVQEYYFDDYVNAGFTHIRIPIRWDGHTTTTAPYMVDSSWLQRVEQVVDWGLSRGLIIVINAHHEHWLLDNYTTSHIQRFEAIWTQVAEYFKDKSENLLFEIINEPYFDLSASQVNALNQNILNIIRVHNPSRIVILTGGGQNSHQAPLQIALPTDSFLMAYFHYYRPFSFTSGTNNNWGSESEKTSMRNDFDVVKTWSDVNNIPILLGEFGVDNTVNSFDRAEYFRHIADLAVSRGFAFSAWEVGTAVKGFYNRAQSTWDNTILDALIEGGKWNNRCPNPGFELGKNTNWNFQVSGATTSDHIENTEVHQGHRALKIDVTSPNTISSVKMDGDFVSASPLKSYVFGAYVKGDATAVNHQIRLATMWEKSDGTNSFNARRYNISTNYQLVGGVQTQPYTDDVVGVKVRLQCGEGAGSYYFDDVHIIEAVDFMNTDFEDGIDYIWTTNTQNGASATFENTSDSPSGNNALKIITTNANATADVGATNPIRKFIDNTVGYNYSFWAKSNAASIMEFQVNYYDNTETLISSETIQTTLTTTYQEYFGDLTPPPNTSFFSIHFHFGANTDTYFIDDVTIDCKALSVSTSQQPSTNTFDWKIYPNPTDNYLNIEWETGLKNGHISLYTISGQALLSSTISEFNQHLQLDISHLPKGIYIIKLNTQKGVFAKKLIVN